MNSSESKAKMSAIALAVLFFVITAVGLGWLATTTGDTVTYALAFAAGLSMIILPCTLPLVFIIVPFSMGKGYKKGLIMAILFGLGVTVTLSIWGAAVALLGEFLGLDSATQIMFGIAGLSALIFGLSELKLIKVHIPGFSGSVPRVIQDQQDYLKVFLMGLFLGNAGVGCPNPAFYVLMTYIAAQGDPVYGAEVSAVHGFGRAVPIILLSILAMLGINATKTLMAQKERISRVSGWGLLGVGLWVLGYAIAGAWFDPTFLHVAWNDLVRSVAPALAEQEKHSHSITAAQAYAPWGIVAFLTLTVIWYYVKFKSSIERPTKWVITALIIVAVLAVSLLPADLFANDNEQTITGPASIERQAYWYSRYNLNAMLLMSGVGERLVPPDGVPQKLAKLADIDLSQFPKNPYLLKAVYASGDPHFQQDGNFKDLSTLHWNQQSMDKTLQPEAQAFTIIKATAKGLRTDYHRYGKDRFVALVQLQEAKAMAETLKTRLTDDQGWVATKTTDGRLLKPEAGQQAAALWAYSSLALMLSDSNLPLYQQLPQTAQDTERFRGWANDQFAASQKLQPQTSRDRALTIEAYGWFAAATNDPALRQKAVDGIRKLAGEMSQGNPSKLEDIAWSIYGLGEAGRVTGGSNFIDQARDLFYNKMEPLWDAKAGVYADRAGETKIVYTPGKTAAVMAAINAVRLSLVPGVGSTVNADLAGERYSTFFQNVIVRSGMQQAHAIPLAVNPAYMEQEPAANFTDPSIPLSKDGDGPYGLCPVYAAEVSFVNGQWTVTDRTFRTAEAMLLSNLSTWEQGDDQDGFIPTSRLLGNMLKSE